MAAKPERSPKAAERIVRAAALLVPAEARAEWLREWLAELSAIASTSRSVVLPARGSVRHGLWLRGEAWQMGTERLFRDLKVGARSLARRPMFALTAGVTLALGIGVTTAVYTVVDRVLLAPLRYPGAERLIRVRATYVPMELEAPGLSPVLLTEWRNRARRIESLQGYEVYDANLVGDGPPEVVQVADVTAGLLSDLLALRPLTGRLLRPDENAEGRNRVALISERLWRSRFGAVADVAGRSIRLDGRSLEVVGVIPTVALLPDVDVWTPHPMVLDYARQKLGHVKVVGRRAPDVTVEGALVDLRQAAETAGEDHPSVLSSWTPAVDDLRSVLVKDVQRHLILLMGAVVAVLLIACVNVANLFLARGIERSGEMTLRRSLGASRGHLLTQVFAEGILVAAGGGAAGVVLASCAVRYLVRLVPAEVPLVTGLSLDGRVLLFAAVLTAGAGTLVGVLPTLRTAMRESGGLGAGRASATRGQRRAGKLLLGFEVAQACALLVAAGLMMNTLYRMSRADSGFDAPGLAFVHLALPDYAYGPDVAPGSRAAFAEALTRRVRAVPGVRAAGLASATPFSGMTFMAGYEQEGGPRPGAGDGGLNVPGGAERIYFSRLEVGPSYLTTLGLPVVTGRSLGPDDYASVEIGALVNETAARSYWPGESPLGRRIRLDEDAPWITIVGVVKDLGHPGLATKGLAELYLPLTSEGMASLRRPDMVVRFEGDPAAMVERLRNSVWQVDPELPIPAASTAVEALGSSLAAPRFYALLLGIFAALAVTLASVGTYGVMAESVARRTREIGIRIALGASAENVRRRVFREGLAVVAAGLVVGLGIALWGSSLMADLLYGIQATDPWTYAFVTLLLVSVAALALWIPTRRATRVDPADTLRAE